MLRWPFSVCLISLTAFASLFFSSVPSPPLQPLRFSHKVHLDYFRDGRHRQSMVSMHRKTFGDYQGGRHGRSMASRHKEVLLKEFEDEELVGDMMENVQKGFCTICHRGFDGNVREEDIEKLHACANCHERKDSEKNEEFVAQMIVDVEQGRCTLCHGDFDHNAGEKVARLGHCAQCHRFSHDRDWQGRQDQRPCMSCHSDAAQFPWASIPNTNTCAACHPLDGELKGTKAEESELLGYIAGKEMISWSRVYDYLPRDIVFSHERHVELGGVRCQQCHGHVELVDGPLSLQIELSMEDCMDCHAAMGAENDCMECHK